MTGTEAPRLVIEREARKAIEAAQKERAQYLARLVELDREMQQMAEVLKAVGSTFHFDEIMPGSEHGRA